MLKSPEIEANPDVLKALRESSGYTVEEIAKKIKNEPDGGRHQN
jgi:hypothetical protein